MLNYLKEIEVTNQKEADIYKDYLNEWFNEEVENYLYLHKAFPNIVVTDTVYRSAMMSSKRRRILIEELARIRKIEKELCA